MGLTASLVTIGQYSPDEVLPFVTASKSLHKFGDFLVSMNSLRYQCFARKDLFGNAGGLICAHCGIIGSIFLLQRGPEHKPDRAFFNLFAINANGHQILMTKDHIIPRCENGKDILSNLQTMCYPCNQKKGGDYNDYHQQILEQSKQPSGK